MLILWLRLLGESCPSVRVRVRMALDVVGERIFSQNNANICQSFNYLNLSMRGIESRFRRDLDRLVEDVVPSAESPQGRFESARPRGLEAGRRGAFRAAASPYVR